MSLCTALLLLSVDELDVFMVFINVSIDVVCHPIHKNEHFFF